MPNTPREARAITTDTHLRSLNIPAGQQPGQEQEGLVAGGAHPSLPSDPPPAAHSPWMLSIWPSLSAAPRTLHSVRTIRSAFASDRKGLESSTAFFPAGRSRVSAARRPLPGRPQALPSPPQAVQREEDGAGAGKPCVPVGQLQLVSSLSPGSQGAWVHPAPSPGFSLVKTGTIQNFGGWGGSQVQHEGTGALTQAPAS